MYSSTHDEGSLLVEVSSNNFENETTQLGSIQQQYPSIGLPRSDSRAILTFIAHRLRVPSHMPRVLTESSLPLLCPCRLSALFPLHETILGVTRQFRSLNFQLERERSTSIVCRITAGWSRRHNVGAMKIHQPPKVGSIALLLLYTLRVAGKHTLRCSGWPWVAVKRNFCLCKRDEYNL